MYADIVKYSHNLRSRLTHINNHLNFTSLINLRNKNVYYCISAANEAGLINGTCE